MGTQIEIVRIVALIVAPLLFACDSNSNPSANSHPPERASTTDLPAHSFAVNSDAGRFEVQVWPEHGTIPMRRLHSWLIRVRNATGEPIVPTEIRVQGGMPQHGHGFDTQPLVTGRLSNGDYRIEGMKFHMNGEWQLQVRIAAEGQSDVAIFKILVGP